LIYQTLAHILSLSCNSTWKL